MHTKYSPPIPVSDLLSLKGRKALVTGSAGGIGAAIALRLAEAGAAVILHGRTRKEQLAKLAQDIAAKGGQASWVLADLADPAACSELPQRAADMFGGLDILVNNAAVQPVAALAEMQIEDVQEMFVTNSIAPVLLTRYFARKPAAGDSRSAAIVNICSIEALRPAAGHSHYASAKAALLHFTQAAALELGRQGVRVNAVCPGLTDRPQLETDWPEGVASWQKSVLLGRLAQPADVADAVLFLASDAARFITGSCLTVDGGMTCKPAW